jgi:uncharacterized protein YigA (DUF484 family)
MTDSEVLDFLISNPEFLKTHEEALAKKPTKTPPRGNKVVSLSDHQLPQLRAKIASLESKILDLVEIGKENEAIFDTLHALILEIIGSQNLQTLRESLYENLKKHFGIDKTAVITVPLRELHVPEENLNSIKLFEGFIEDLEQPRCSSGPLFDIHLLLELELSQSGSFAYVPLMLGEEKGVLIMYSEDERFFSSDDGDLFLKKLGQIISAIATKLKR